MHTNNEGSLQCCNKKRTLYLQAEWLVIIISSRTLAVGKQSEQKGKGKYMLGAQEQRSEVARLLSQISAEYEAAQRGLSGLSCGTSQHEFITRRMENMGQLHNELQSLVGDAAIAMIADELNNH